MGNFVKDFFFDSEPEKNINILSKDTITNSDYNSLVTKEESELSLEEKFDSFKSDQLNKFLEQLEVLKNVTGLTSVSVYQAALATSKVTVEDLKFGIQGVKELLNTDLDSFQTNNINLSNNEQIKLTEEINELKSQIDIKTNEIVKLTEEIREVNSKADGLKTEINNKVLETNRNTEEYRSKIEKYLKEMDNLNSEINLNLGGVK